MSVCAVIEIEERRLEIIRAQRREIALVFNHDLRTIETSNLSLSLQLAYLGVMVHYTKLVECSKHEMNELLCLFIDMAEKCGKMVKIIRTIANSFQCQSDSSDFHLDEDDRCLILRLREMFVSCLEKAEAIRGKICLVAPNPVIEVRKLYKKIHATLGRVMFHYDTNFCISSYRKQARVSQYLFMATKLQYAAVTLAALGSFATGIRHVIKTIDGFLALFQSGCDRLSVQDLFNLHKEVSLVVIATATAVYFESISISITEISIFSGDSKYAGEKGLEVFKQMMVLFLKNIRKVKKVDGAVCSSCLPQLDEYFIDFSDDEDDSCDEKEDVDKGSDSDSDSDKEECGIVVHEREKDEVDIKFKITESEVTIHGDIDDIKEVYDRGLIRGDDFDSVRITGEETMVETRSAKFDE